MTQRDRLIEELKDRAVKLDLTFVHSKAGFMSGERFAIMKGRYCLIAADDPSNIEQYLFGYRDGKAMLHGRADKETGDKIGAALDWMGGDDD